MLTSGARFVSYSSPRSPYISEYSSLFHIFNRKTYCNILLGILILIISAESESAEHRTKEILAFNHSSNIVSSKSNMTDFAFYPPTLEKNNTRQDVELLVIDYILPKS